MITASTSPSGGERTDNQVTLTYIMKCLGGGTRIRVDVSACCVKRDLPTALRSIGLNIAPLWTYLLATFCSTFFFHWKRIVKSENFLEHPALFTDKKSSILALPKFLPRLHPTLLENLFCSKRKAVTSGISVKNVELNLSCYPFASLW